MKRFKTFSIRALLLGTAGVSVLGVVATAPSRTAAKIERLISQADLVGGNEYLNDVTREDLNTVIHGFKSDIPAFTHSFATERLPRSLADYLLLRQPVVIEYTANPIPPEWQGSITRHRVTFVAGWFGLRETERSDTLLYEYWD